MATKKTTSAPVEPQTNDVIAPVATLSPLEALKSDTDVLLMIYGKTPDGNFYSSITPEDERAVYEMVKKRKKDNQIKKSLLIYLDTPGGNAYTAVKIMDILRNVYDKITIGVAEEAKSSGTLMCLGADEIIMSYASELGPLDKPMVHPENETSMISALDIVRSLDTVIDTASEKQKKLARDLLKKHSLKQAQALEIAGNFIAQLMSPLLCKEDSKLYNQALRLLKMAELYGSRFLNSYSLSWVSNEALRERVAKTVLTRLIWEYPDHNFAICRDEVENELFLSVQKAEDVEYWDELWDEFIKNTDVKGKVIKYL